jgi:glycosyltransferase involved in cell wall biosynthesis
MMSAGTGPLKRTSPPVVPHPSLSESQRSTPSARPRGRPLRVCHLAYTFYENDNRVIRYAQTLAERGDHVDVIGLRRPGQSRIDSTGAVNLSRIQRRSISERSAWAYLAKVLWFFIKSTCLLTFRQLRSPYDVVHVHNVPDFLVFAAWLPKLRGARIILDIHDILPELYAGKFASTEHSLVFRSLLRVERMSCRFADHVIVANHLWHEKLVRRTVGEERCTTIMNHPDLRLFRPLPPEERRRDGRFVFLYPGTLNHHQGLDLAIEAFALVRHRMPGAELHIYGEGPARASLLKLAEERGCAQSVKIMDRVPLVDVCRVMAAADAGIVPKRGDGFGNEAFSTKTLEFMASCVPVIVSRTKVDQYYFDDTLVQFFTPGDTQDLARAALEVYEGRSRHEAWIAKARAFAVQNSWQERADDYRMLVDSVVFRAAEETIVINSGAR